MLGRFVKTLQTGLLFVAYPLIIYLLLYYQVAWLGALLVFSMIVWKLQHRKNWLLWTGVLLAGVLLAARLFGSDAILKMSPLIIHISLFIIFAQSLNSTPMIERFARLDIGDDLPAGVAGYCRKVTLLWTGFFAANIAGCVWLALWGDDRTWVLYNGLIVYLLIGALLLGEYLWRHVVFRDMDIPSLGQTVRNMINNGHKVWEQEKHDHAG